MPLRAAAPKAAPDLAGAAGRIAPARFSISVHNAAAREFFLSLVKGTPDNIVVHPLVEGMISLSLKDVTVGEVLETVRDMYGYEIQRTPIGYEVFPIRPQTRVFHVDYLAIRRSGQSQIQVNSGQLTSVENTGEGGGTGGNGGGPGGTPGGMGGGGPGGATGGAGGYGGGPGGPGGYGGGPGSQGGGGAGGASAPVSSIYTRYESDFWRDLTNAVCTIVAAPQEGGLGTQGGAIPAGCERSPLAITSRGAYGAPPAPPATEGGGTGKSVMVDAQSGVVVVRALSDELRTIESFLKDIEKNVRRQVLLEGKIVEVVLNDNFQAGINWAALLGGDDVVLGQIGGGTILNQGTSNIQGNPIELNRGFDALLGTASEAFGGMGTLALNLHNFKAFIELLKTQGDVRVLSSPRVATMNNQKAVIKVGTDEFFVTDISVQNTALSAGNNSQAVDVTIRPFFSGIAFDVTPQISDKNEITLHIHPTVSDVTEQTKLLPVSAAAGAAPFPVPLAFSSIRESDSVVRVQNNQVVVIGGLMKDAKTNKTASTPFLEDLPVIGPLFRHQLDAEQKSELVIMLRPTIVSNDATPYGRDDRLRGYEDRLKGYYNSLAPPDQEMPRP